MPVSLRAEGAGVRPAPLEAHLALAEFLLGVDLSASPTESAQWVLEWLGTQAGVRQALCLMADADRGRLTAVAGYQLRESRVRALSVPLDDRSHPLVQALHRERPVEVSVSVLGARTRARARPADRGLTFAAVRLAPPTRPDDPIGLLLVTPAAAAGVETHWAARLLAAKLGRLREAEALIAGQRRLGRQLALVQSMINTVPDPILLTDAEGRIVATNARAEALFASTEQESEGRRRAIALNNMLFSASLTGRAIEGAEPVRRELLLVDPDDGSDLLFELLSAVATDPEGGVAVVSVLRNVTDLRRAAEEIEENFRKAREAEAEVRAQRERLELVIRSVADPILVTDASGAIVLTNAAADRLFGAPPEADPAGQARVRANDAHFSSFLTNVLVAGGDTPRQSARLSLIEPGSGEALPVEAAAGKVLSRQGELLGIVTILHDLREALERERLYEQVKRASEELEQKVREATAELVRQNELLRRQALQLEQASALKSRFLANMSHEFRTPLNAILGYTSMLLQGVAGEATPQQRRSLSRVDSSARHLLALINDILDISRIEAGKMPVHVTEFPIPELIAEVMAEVEPIIARTGLTVTRELPPTLPLLETDRAKVKQIVLNLLTNALKFTPEGWVKVSAGADDGLVSIAVADTGIGIAEEDQTRIFEDFSQADSSPTRAYSGAGLGLSISRRLAAMLGGQITLVSKPGRGSTFTLVLPRTRRAR